MGAVAIVLTGGGGGGGGGGGSEVAPPFVVPFSEFEVDFSGGGGVTVSSTCCSAMTRS